VSTWTDFFVRLGERLLRWRWGILALISLSIIAFEVSEHRVTTLSVFHHQFVFEVLVFSITFPLFAGICLSLAIRDRSLRSRALRELEFHRNLSAGLAAVHNWDDLARLLYQSLRQMVAVRGVTLLVYRPSVAAYEVAAAWGEEFVRSSRLIPLAVQDHCSISAASDTSPLLPCHCLQRSNAMAQEACCLPLFYNDLPVALILCLFPHSLRSKSTQTRALAEEAWKIASAVEYLDIQDALALHQGSGEAGQQMVVHGLHAGLAARLIDVRRQLSQINPGEDLQLDVLRQELERLRQIVNEAYSEVRQTLERLLPDVTPDLTTTLQVYIHKIRSRSALRVTLVAEDRPLYLPPPFQRQVLNTFQGIIENLEKQSHKQQVEVRLLRLERGLMMTLTEHDDEDQIHAQRNGGPEATFERPSSEGDQDGSQTAAMVVERPLIRLWFPLPYKDMRDRGRLSHEGTDRR